MSARAPSAVVIAAALAMLLSASSAAAFTHVVEPGESLSSVAATDGISVEELAAANGLSDEAQLIAGSDLAIPSQGSAGAEPTPSSTEASEAGESAATAPETGEAPASSAAGGGYVVQPGDTLSAIAASDGTTVEALASMNGLDPSALLPTGTVLTLPGSSPQATEATATVAAEAAPAEGPPYPTEETVSPSEVGAIAEEHGVPPSLAEAVAEQESGFNNGVTSSADARGVMQILPETWSFVSQSLAGPTPLEPASASSNVRGGVLLLQYLLNETGDDPAAAAASYYQGLESVRQNGEYPETEAYVNSVLALQGRFGGE